MTTYTISSFKANSILRPERDYMVDTVPSRFTAVNGRESSNSTMTLNGDAGESRSASSDRPAPFNPPGEASPRRHSEEERSRTSTGHDEWAPSNGTNGDGPHTGPSATQSAASHHAPPTNGSPPYKRKRTESPERQNSSTHSYQSHGLPRSPPVNVTNARETTGLDRGRPSSSGPEASRPDPYTAAPNPYPSRHEEGREMDRPAAPYYEHKGRAHPETHHAESHDDVRSTETRLAEALRRESAHVDPLDRRSESRTAGSPDDDGSRGHSRLADAAGPEQTPTSGVQVDHRRRKRVFSNRTKTGCLTCRRRKKKCDELKPECNNCIRGGFVCEGYSNRVEWTKSSREKVPVPLQAKDGEAQSTPTHAPPSMYGGTPSSTMGQSNPSREQQSPGPYRSAHVSHAAGSGGHSRPILLDDDRDRAGGVSGGTKSRAPSDARAPDWSKPSWPSSGHAPYLNEHLPKGDFSRVPPIRDAPPRAGEGSSDTTTPPSTLSHRSLLHAPGAHSSSTSSTTPTDPQSAQASAQLALQHHNSLHGPHSPNRSEKEKMLAGELYFPNAPELVYERDRCKAAIWRFNNSMNPTLGISREERLRLFKDVVQPREPPASSSTPSTGGSGSGSTPQSSPMGRVGENVIVEAPFICDYGYNITIARDVLIDTNCTIKDTCSVNIGPRVVIGPNVKLLTATMPIDPRRRKGSQGPSLGRSIVIEEDCWIGAGAIILPGLSIGKSSTVGAGSVVTRDVPPFTVVAGNPARVHRGIYPNDAPA